MSNLSTVVNVVLGQCDFRNNPYFAALADGIFEKSDFIETQIQFYFAVQFFNRPMAALAAKIPDPQLRINVIRNLWEEHGEGDVERVHGATFLELLHRLDGLKSEDILRRSLWPEVRAFNTVLIGTCVIDEYMTGVGMMGVIERMFAEISALMGQGIIKCGWLPLDRIVHYTLHADLDIQHSQDFFDIVEKPWAHSAEDRYAIEQGIRLGAYIFNRLYEDLFRNRSRRLDRVTAGPHSRAAGQ